MTVILNLDEGFYDALLSQQGGLPRYRGAPMMGGSFWSSILSFARGLAARAATHISNAISSATPHVRGLATRAVESAIDGAVDKVTSKLKTMQEGGSPRKKKKSIKAKYKGKNTHKKSKVLFVKVSTKKATKKKREARKDYELDDKF